MHNKHKEYNDLDSLIDNALDGVLRNAVESGENYVLIPGDLTKDGELASHEALAKKLEAFEEETGIQVLVIPGNHDINGVAASYAGETPVEVETLSSDQWEESLPTQA